MAKNRDHRKKRKADEPKLPCPTRRPRPDLMRKVERLMMPEFPLKYVSAMDVAKEIGAHRDDVQDCLVSLVRQGKVHMSTYGTFMPAFKKEPRPKPGPTLDAGLVLKVRRAFERVERAKVSDFAKWDGADACIAELAQKGFLFDLKNGEFSTQWTGPHGQLRTWTPAPFGSPTRRAPEGKLEIYGKFVCKLCGFKTRRHARSEVHDEEQCRKDMIALVMSE